jgi:hypothetical protein
MAGDEIDGRGVGGLAAFTAQASKQIFKRHIALALDQQSHRRESGTPSAMLAMQLDHALWPIREPVRLTKGGGCIPYLWMRTEKEQDRSCLGEVRGAKLWPHGG